MYFLYILLILIGIIFISFFLLLILLLIGKTRITLYLEGQGDSKIVDFNLNNFGFLNLVNLRYLHKEGEVKFSILKIPLPSNLIHRPTGKKPARKKEKETPRKNIFKSIEKIPDTTDFLKNIFKKVLEKIELFKVTGDLKIGLGSPYRTGLMLGFYHSIWYIIPQIKNIKIEPDFFSYKLEGNAQITLDLYLYKFFSFIVYIFRNKEKFKY